ncbi:hypothetical protein [Micromonospora sp. GCM10011541]|uniref:hypothetical protein n=1 Tax=Micromonospora sp. GCM10011541 TaxID=3317336 RepID=UPI003618DF7A
MKIVRAHTGAKAVPVPDRGVIFVDPDAGHTTTINAIQAVLPEAHPDVVEHWWADSVTPAGEPLTDVLTRDQIQQARQFYRPARPVDIKPGRHRNRRERPALSKPARVGIRSASLVAAAALGLLLAPVVTGGPQSASADGVWAEPVFTTVSQTGAGWDCKVELLLAECVSDEGIPVTVEVLNGASARTYNFRYDDPVSQEKHRADIKVFKTEKAEQEWHTYQSAHRPNLVKGKRWVAYGTDAKRVDKYTKVLKAKHK